MSGKEVLLEHNGQLLNLSRTGQLAMRQVREAHLRRVEWDRTHLPVRLFPFVRGESDRGAVIAIDPREALGRPIVVRQGISTAIIADRVGGGESVEELAHEYGLEPRETEEAIVYERAARSRGSSPIAISAGISVEEHGAHFRHDTPADEWIPEVAKRGWIALTHDARIRYRPNEKETVLASGLGLSVIVGKVSHSELARNFVTSIERVERFAARERRPFIAKLHLPPAGDAGRKSTAKGRIERWV